MICHTRSSILERIPSMKELPKSSIPSLRGSSEWEYWLEKKRTDKKKDVADPDSTGAKWVFRGEAGYEAEFGAFAEAARRHCETAMQRNHGRVKIVSFGGGMMRGMLDLREKLIRFADQMNLTPQLSFVDYSLTKTLGKTGLAEAEMSSLLVDGTMKLHIGPIELRDLSDAEGADCMLSAKGGFFHALYPHHLHELVVKTSHFLAPKGKAFLEVILTGRQQEDDQMAANIQAALGPEFTVRANKAPNCYGYFLVSRS